VACCRIAQLEIVTVVIDGVPAPRNSMRVVAQPIVDKLDGAAQKAMQPPKSAAALVKQGYDPHFPGPDQFAPCVTIVGQIMARLPC
jgi:hypothetical protein